MSRLRELAKVGAVLSVALLAVYGPVNAAPPTDTPGDGPGTAAGNPWILVLARIASLEAKLDAVERKLDAGDPGSQRIEAKLDSASHGLGAIRDRLDRVEAKLDDPKAEPSIEAKLDRLATTIGSDPAGVSVVGALSRLEAKLDKVEAKGDRAETKLDHLGGIVGQIPNTAGAIEAKLDELGDVGVRVRHMLRALEAKLDRIETKDDHAEVKLDQLVQVLGGPTGVNPLAALEAKLDRVEVKLDAPPGTTNALSIEAKLDQLLGIP